MKNGDMPAMPTSPNDHDAEWAAARSGGLTKREMFAMHIMSGMAAQSHGYTSYNLMAQDAVEQANALLSVLGESK